MLPDPNEDARYGWLSVTGKLYPCKYADHAGLAVLICKSNGWNPKGELDFDAEQILENRNFIKKSKSGYYEPYYAPSQRQLDVLLTWEVTFDKKIKWLDLYRD